MAPVFQPPEDSGERPETYVQPFAQDQDRRSARHDSSGFAHQKRMVESNITGEICRVLPSMAVQHIYPQVPSFAGEERNVVNLLGITENGRLVVIEIEASPDPDLPFQALDDGIAVERHRAAGDFQRNDYVAGCEVQASRRCFFGGSIAGILPDFDAMDPIAAAADSFDGNRIKPNMAEGDQSLAPKRDGQLG